MIFPRKNLSLIPFVLLVIPSPNGPGKKWANTSSQFTRLSSSNNLQMFLQTYLTIRAVSLSDISCS